MIPLKPIDINVISEPLRSSESEQEPAMIVSAPHFSSLERPGENAPPDSLEGQIVRAFRKVFDPEIPVNIYDLGLIYALTISAEGDVLVDMTLTAPGCPVAQTFPGIVEAAVLEVPGVKSAHVEVVWDPPWTQDRMSEVARLELGMF